MNHIVDACPFAKFDGGLLKLVYETEDDAVKWLESTATAAFAKLNEKLPRPDDLDGIFRFKG